MKQLDLKKLPHEVQKYAQKLRDSKTYLSIALSLCKLMEKIALLPKEKQQAIKDLIKDYPTDIITKTTA